MRIQQPLVFRDWSRGTIRTVQGSIVPSNSLKLALNMDSDNEIGSLVTRTGTSLIGTRTQYNSNCMGLHYHRDTISSAHKLFGVFSDGANNVIFEMSDASSSLGGDTDNIKTRFCTFMNSTVRVNGVDAVKSFNGSSWVTSGGAFDEANMPVGNVVVEWKDRVYTAGVSSQPNILYYSGVADPDARTVSWTATDAGNIEIEQEDGGGAITALAKVPGALIILKERTMKRWDGSSTYPEDLINVGAPSQEAVCMGRGMVFIGNQQGVWMTSGEYPVKISKAIQDLWDAIPAANISSICSICDEDYVYFYVGDITLGENSYNNVCFKFNLDNKTWDVYSYYNDFKVFAWYIDGDKKVIVGGDDDGKVLKINSGYTDYGTVVQPISFSVETQDLEIGSRANIKEINEVAVFSENMKLGQFLYRTNSKDDIDWKSVRNITNDVETIDNFKARGNWFNFKISGITDSGRVKFLGFEIPSGSVSISDNAKE